MFKQNASQSTKVGICEVCRRLDRDSTPKPVEWCPTCRADICDRCRRDWTRRLKAASMGLGYSRTI